MLVVLVAWMTYATIAVMLRASETVNKWTYASTMHAIWGRRAAAGVHGSIIFGCVGFVALYMIVTCDVSAEIDRQDIYARYFSRKCILKSIG